jgi:uncharacterized SAM-binding protein YcdF (DUF218 family)
MPSKTLQKSRRSRRTQFLWWGTGFVSAFGLLLACTLWMASSVYSELPEKARLGPDFKPADVIVCLTGGRGRIRKALELYEKGYAKTLYISGTDRQVQMHEILKELKWVGPVDDSHIILENLSTNTIQNAIQVNRYVREQGLKSVLLFTSVYHARRAYYIFRKILPHDVHLDVSWYEAEPFESSVWWTHWNGIVVTVSEFLKFFYAWVRLLALV